MGDRDQGSDHNRSVVPVEDDSKGVSPDLELGRDRSGPVADRRRAWVISAAFAGASLLVLLTVLAWSLGGGDGEPVLQSPANANALVQRGLEAYQQGDFPMAVDAWEQAVAADPGNLEAPYNLGVARLANGDFAGAEAAFREAVSLSPDSEAARYNLALVLERTGRDAAAVAEYRKVTARNPKASSALWNMGLLLYDEGDVSEARGLLRRAIAIEPALEARTPPGVVIN